MGGSKGSSKMRVPRHYMAWHAGICQGPVDAIKDVRVGEKVAWRGSVSDNTTLTVKKEGLFGGIKKEGGVAGKLAMLFGKADQLVPGSLASRLGDTASNLPGFRGLVSLFFYDGGGGFYWGTQPYLKPVWVTVQRIPAKDLDEATAAIPRQGAEDPFSVFYEGFVDGLSGYQTWEHPQNTYTGDPLNYYDIVPWYDGNALRIGRVQDPPPSGAGHPSIYQELPVAAPLQQVTLRFQLEDLQDNDNGVIVLRDADKNSVFAFGVARDKSVDSLQRPNVAFSDIPGQLGNPIGLEPVEIGVRYRLQVNYDAVDQQFTATVTNDETNVEFGSVTLNLAETADIKSVHFEQDDSASERAGVSLWDNIRVTVGVPVLDANPAHVIYECLTDGDWGMGGDPDDIDTASFQAAAARLYGEGFGVFLQWQAQSTIQEFINGVLDHINGALFPHPRTGKTALRLLRDDLDVDNLRILTPDNATLTNFSRKAWGETTNEIVVTWTRPETEKEETITAQDLANIAQQGAVVSASRNYHGVRTPELAQRLADRELRAASAPLASCEAEVSREFWDLVPYDGLKVTWPEYGLDELVMRVMKVNYGDSDAKMVKLSLLEDVFALPLASYVEPATGQWEGPEPPAVVETVRFLPVLGYTASNQGVNLETLAYPATAVAPIAVNPTDDSSAVYDVLVEQSTPSGGTAWAEVGTTRRFPARATLGVELPVAIRSTAVDLNGEALAQVATDHLLLIGGDGLDHDELELALITAVDDVTGLPDLLRGVLDTVPRAWPAGTTVTLVSLQDLEGIPKEYADGETVRLRLLTQTGVGRLEDEEAPTETGLAVSRATRPTRPADLKVNGTGLESATGVAWADQLVITWAHRNRLLEDSVMYAWDDAALPLEDGVTYTVEADALDGSLAIIQAAWYSTDVGATDTHTLDLTVDAPPSGTVYLVIKVIAKRDGESAWQAARITVTGIQPPTDLQGEYVPVFAPTDVTLEEV